MDAIVTIILTLLGVIFIGFIGLYLLAKVILPMFPKTVQVILRVLAFGLGAFLIVFSVATTLDPTDVITVPAAIFLIIFAAFGKKGADAFIKFFKGIGR